MGCWVMMIMEDGRGLGLAWAGQSSVVCNQPENGALELASRLQQVVCWTGGIGAGMFRRVTVERKLV